MRGELVIRCAGDMTSELRDSDGNDGGGLAVGERRGPSARKVQTSRVSEN